MKRKGLCVLVAATILVLTAGCGGNQGEEKSNNQVTDAVSLMVTPEVTVTTEPIATPVPTATLAPTPTPVPVSYMETNGIEVLGAGWHVAKSFIWDYDEAGNEIFELADYESMMEVSETDNGDGTKTISALLHRKPHVDSERNTWWMSGMGGFVDLQSGMAFLPMTDYMEQTTILKQEDKNYELRLAFSFEYPSSDYPYYTERYTLVCPLEYEDAGFYLTGYNNDAETFTERVGFWKTLDSIRHGESDMQVFGVNQVLAKTEKTEQVDDSVSEPTHVPAKREGITVPDEYRKSKKGYEGTVELISYKTKSYYGDGQEITKPAYVYLPYGYDETKKYNVLYLLHSFGGDEKEWGLHNQFSTVRLAMDNLVYYKDVEPFIIVAPNVINKGLQEGEGIDADAAYGGFLTELRNDLIPYIEANYATYADYDENGYDMAATRDHRAVAGGSFGGMQSVDIGMCECLDLFSYFGPFSPGATVYYPEEVAEKIDSFKEYEIRCIFNVCGDEELGYANTSRTLFGELKDLTDKVKLGENLFMYIVKGGHDTKTWSLAFYNFAQVIFK